MGQDLATLTATVSHVVAAVRDLVVPGYSLEREFGNVRILRRDAAGPPVRQWREHAPVIVFDLVWKTMQQIDADFPAPPANAASSSPPDRRSMGVTAYSTNSARGGKSSGSRIGRHGIRRSLNIPRVWALDSNAYRADGLRSGIRRSR